MIYCLAASASFFVQCGNKCIFKEFESDEGKIVHLERHVGLVIRLSRNRRVTDFTPATVILSILLKGFRKTEPHPADML